MWLRMLKLRIDLLLRCLHSRLLPQQLDLSAVPSQLSGLQPHQFHQRINSHLFILLLGHRSSLQRLSALRRPQLHQLRLQLAILSAVPSLFQQELDRVVHALRWKLRFLRFEWSGHLRRLVLFGGLHQVQRFCVSALFGGLSVLQPRLPFHLHWLFNRHLQRFLLRQMSELSLGLCQLFQSLKLHGVSFLLLPQPEPVPQILQLALSQLHLRRQQHHDLLQMPLRLRPSKRHLLGFSGLFRPIYLLILSSRLLPLQRHLPLLPLLLRSVRFHPARPHLQHLRQQPSLLHCLHSLPYWLSPRTCN